MRRITELLLLLLVCGGISFLLHWHLVSRPMLISGTVTNWTTGRPVPGVMVRYKELNGSSEAARTDGRGRFTAAVPREGWPYLLYAADTRPGSIFQSTFGRTVVVYTRGEQHSGIVIPAIPGTELSGHVYDEGVAPLPGCEVRALTDEPDQAPQLKEIDFQLTDAKGSFTFTRLGADRYFVLVRCRRYLPSEKQGYNGVVLGAWKNRSSWQPMFFPQAVSLKKAKPITLLPGQRRNGIDFHLRSVPQYSVDGKVIFSGKPLPKLWPEMGLDHPLDVSAVPADPALAATAPNGEACDRDDNGRSFHCDFLSPGAYQLRFAVIAGVRSQGANVRFEIKADGRVEPELTVQLHEYKYKPPPQLPTSENGFLHLQRICPTPIKEGWINVYVWELRWPNLQPDRGTNCAEERTWPVPAGNYTVAVYQAGFFGHDHGAKILALLRQHGKHVVVRKGSRSHVSVPVWTTDEMIRWALTSLRQNR